MITLFTEYFAFFRFQDPALHSLFDEETGVCKDRSRCLPSIHISLMRIWITWLEKFPEDFRENPTLQVGGNSNFSFGGAVLLLDEKLNQ
jgi:hypothetical protein